MCRQIENQVTKHTAESIWVSGMYSGHQLFHVKQKHLMLAWVLLTQVKGHVCRWVQISTKEALAAHELKKLRILPEGDKLSVDKLLLQFVSQGMRQLGRQHCLQELIRDDSGSQWFNSKAMKGHSQLAQGQTDVIAPLSSHHWVAVTMILGKR